MIWVGLTPLTAIRDPRSQWTAYDRRRHVERQRLLAAVAEIEEVLRAVGDDNNAPSYDGWLGEQDRYDGGDEA
jgi:hypothetical protein